MGRFFTCCGDNDIESPDTALAVVDSRPKKCAYLPIVPTIAVALACAFTAYIFYKFLDISPYIIIPVAIAVGSVLAAITFFAFMWLVNQCCNREEPEYQGLNINSSDERAGAMYASQFSV